MDANRKHRLGYAISLIGALLVGANLLASGAHLFSLLALAGFAWAGGIYFLLILQERRG